MTFEAKRRPGSYAATGRALDAMSQVRRPKKDRFLSWACEAKKHAKCRKCDCRCHSKDR